MSSMTKNCLKLIKEKTENVEVIEVKLNNRKTKKVGGKNETVSNKKEC